MSVRGGINTVKINGELVHITDLDQITLCNEWSKLKRELNDLYEINRIANQGFRGFILKIMGVKLPDKTAFIIGGLNSANESIYTTGR